jgi:ATP synthase protein I
MSDEKTEDAASAGFEETVGGKEQRKLLSREKGKQSPWFGLGMFGLVGWSIVLPMLLGVFAGSWIDDRWPTQVSWTLTLMFLGLALGCANAWLWIQKESKE